MALVIHSNGIVEELVPLDKTFSDEELVQSFNEYNEIKSHRLSEIPNTWCIWGDKKNPDDIEFNKIASEVVDYDVFSHIIFIHDSELNIDWKLTDDIIYKNYSAFLEDTGKFINQLMDEIAIEHAKEYEEHGGESSMIFLSTMGHTEDMRVLFTFNPDEQSETFYEDGAWEKFSYKILEYLEKKFEKEIYEKGKPLVIYSDSKTIVIVEKEHVDKLVELMIKEFEANEDYEKCSIISNIKNDWYNKSFPPENKNKDTIDPSTGSQIDPSTG